MRKWLAVLLCPLTVQAAGEGAWQDSGMGVTLKYRGVSASSSPLSARQLVSGV
ncbi:flagellar protein FlhE, partial [Salmonella enterica subsp. enterica serovar Infantis]